MQQLTPEKRGLRLHVSLASIMICFLVPVLIFAWSYAFMIFQFRWKNFIPACVVGPGVAFLVALFVTYFGAYRKFSKRRPVRTGLILSFGLWFSAIFSLLQSERTFTEFSSQYYGIRDLDIYVNVDAAKDSGQTYMDAGQAYFKEGTFVAAGKAIALTNNGVYCVAPILRAPLENGGGAAAGSGPYTVPPSGTIDFWAVGLDCCGKDGKQWKCGPPDGRAGLRMLRDDQRPFYLLAIQEWAAGTGLPIRHPLFFHWVKDPLMEVDSYSISNAHKFVEDLATFCVFNLVLVMVLQYGLCKLKLP